MPTTRGKSGLFGHHMSAYVAGFLSTSESTRSWARTTKVLTDTCVLGVGSFPSCSFQTRNSRHAVSVGFRDKGIVITMSRCSLPGVRASVARKKREDAKRWAHTLVGRAPLGDEESELPKDFAWLERHLKMLLAWGNQAKGVRPNVFNEFGPWTCLKLIALKYHTDVYTTIMNQHLRRLGLDAMVYVDVLAGSGLNRIRDTGSFVAGSSVVACLSPRVRRFDYVLGIENDTEYALALKKRMALFCANGTFDVVPYDATFQMDAIESLLTEHNAHYLAFVDYEGMKGFPWENMTKLLENRGDLFITFIPNVGRVWARGQSADLDGVATLVGEDVARSAKTQDDLYTGYLDKIREVRRHTLDIRISSGGAYYYMLIFCTAQKSRPGWFGVLRELKEKIEQLDGDDVKTALDRIEGRQA